MSAALAPGAFRPPRDVWGPFARAAKALDRNSLVVLDARVADLHPRVKSICRKRAGAVVLLSAGERTKTLSALGRILVDGAGLNRGGTLVAVGGGTVGDVSTVAAHLIKRGVRLIHVPTTLLAAVDSSLGGKGAIHSSAGGLTIKNAAGAFHYADACWICPELFESLPDVARRQGAIEAWKMAASLSAPTWNRWRRARPTETQLIREARRLKALVCRADPYEQTGHRRVLNFGHTFGHVVESLTQFRVPHGDAVGMGMLCALDVGRATGITPESVAREVEGVLVERAGVKGRAALGRALSLATPSRVARLLAADKKAGPNESVRMVLLRRVGAWEVRGIDQTLWRGLLRTWMNGARP
jgi:3-dehydroquinate synthase